MFFIDNKIIHKGTNMSFINHNMGGLYCSENFLSLSEQRSVSGFDREGRRMRGFRPLSRAGHVENRPGLPARRASPKRARCDDGPTNYGGAAGGPGRTG